MAFEWAWRLTDDDQYRLNDPGAYRKIDNLLDNCRDCYLFLEMVYAIKNAIHSYKLDARTSGVSDALRNYFSTTLETDIVDLGYLEGRVDEFLQTPR